MGRNIVLVMGIALLLGISSIFGFLYFQGLSSTSGSLSQDHLFVVYSELPRTVDPYTLHTGQRMLQDNVFEGLTVIDKFFRPKRALALSWGSLSNTRWEFRLRKDILFHDGSLFTADDVIRSYQEVKKSGDAGLLSLLGPIKDMVKTDTYTVAVETTGVDPLLLTRLSYIPITKKVVVEGSETFIGTGPYYVKDMSESQITFEYFDKYWDRLPVFRQVTVKGVQDKYDRFIGLMQGNIDILASVPVSSDNVKAITDSSIVELVSVPSLELIYFMFNSDPSRAGGNPLAEQQTRRAISLALDTKNIASFADGFATPVNQYIASGIFGFNPDLSDKEYSEEAAARIIGRQRFDLEITITKDFRILAEYIRSQLLPLNINVTYDVVNNIEEFLEKLQSGNVQSYILGWRFDLGDSLDFLKTHIHTKGGELGQYNASGYSNKKVDSLIGLAESELDETRRLGYLQQIQSSVMEDFIGVPLFETKTIMAKKKSIQLEPRLDGSLVFSDIQPK